MLLEDAHASEIVNEHCESVLYILEPILKDAILS